MAKEKEYSFKEAETKEKPIDKKPEPEVKKDIPKHAFYRG